ncbi:hypothetical protein GGR26_003069 [Lewinella marina]|uniref:Uncharacterized protein n=1 Tax=Neolewinella marina TaxID=438751 RepID=A0A2G0CEI7_9BACT|nr:hypothetical protein [Neolewinella marina]NJB87289.1 hypothetical protein [Neolewinella marina]PHK98389.1 hypothetical protein CGL56_11885 [Neolewinella marina]
METQSADHGYPYQKLQALKGLIGMEFISLHLRAAQIETEEISVYEDFVVELRSDTEVALLHLANGWFTPPELPGRGHLNLTLRTYAIEEVTPQDAPSEARAEYESVTKPLGVRYAALSEPGPLEEVQVNEGHAGQSPTAPDVRSVESIVLHFATGKALVLISAEDRVVIKSTTRKALENGADPLHTIVDGQPRTIESIRVSAIAS